MNVMDPIMITVFHVMGRVTLPTENVHFRVRVDPTRTRSHFNASRVIPPVTRVMVPVVAIVPLATKMQSTCPINVFPVVREIILIPSLINVTCVMTRVLHARVRLRINVYHVLQIYIWTPRPAVVPTV